MLSCHSKLQVTEAAWFNVQEDGIKDKKLYLLEIRNNYVTILLRHNASQRFTVKPKDGPADRNGNTVFMASLGKSRQRTSCLSKATFTTMLQGIHIKQTKSAIMRNQLQQSYCVNLLHQNTTHSALLLDFPCYGFLLTKPCLKFCMRFSLSCKSPGVSKLTSLDSNHVWFML